MRKTPTVARSKALHRRLGYVSYFLRYGALELLRSFNDEDSAQAPQREQIINMPATRLVATQSDSAMTFNSLQTPRPQRRAHIKINPIKVLAPQAPNAYSAVGFNHEHIDPTTIRVHDDISMPCIWRRRTICPV